MQMSMDKLFSEGEVIDTKASIAEDVKSSPRLNIASSVVRLITLFGHKEINNLKYSIWNFKKKKK